ncbi:MAG: DNA polymerase III subunit delta [Ruminococcus sp.]|nr:DNA polymerase III subunit delta [Ruminococcus sp.]
MAKLTETEFKKMIKGKNYSSVYAIYGNEQLLIKGYTKKLVQAIIGKKPNEFNYHEFEGDINLDDFAASVQFVPFMSEFNCVLVSDVHFDSMDKSDIDRFKDIVALAVMPTILIISMPTYIPSKNKAAFNSLIKSIEKSGITLELQKLNQSMLEKYVAKWANENGKMISHINASKLITYCGDDLNLLKNETNKIASYAKGEEITLEDINKLATVNLEAKVFNLSDAVLSGDGQRAYNTLDQLFYQREEPIMMLYVLGMSYIDAYRIRVADECGVLKDDVAKDFSYKNRAFTLANARKSTSKVTTEALRKSLDVLIEADERFKTTTTNSRLYMEQVISRLLQISREGRAYG